MPIPKHLRHFYRGALWKAARAAVAARAGGCCERCGKPDRALVQTATWPRERRMAWALPGGAWRDQDGNPAERPAAGIRWSEIVLSAAHLNHVCGDDRHENLKFLCQWCHLMHDRERHAWKRKTRKDGTRPLFSRGGAVL